MNPLSPGTVLQQRYAIVKLLGKGGMGAVYQATDKKFGSTVALKQMIVTGEALVAAFEREAILLNGLRHAALPVVFDHFAEADGQFLVMQFIPGKDLAELLTEQGGPFPLAQVARWADQLLDALEYLHGRTPPIIHRDIKPQNVKLTPEDSLVLLDFGLAKGDLSGDAIQQRSLVGFTPVFASLEQMRGLSTDPRSDLYSAAATIYCLLTGRPPVDALARADALLSGKPDPLPLASDVNPQVPRTVAEIVRQAMTVSRDERLASAKEMRRQLRAAFKAVRAVTDDLDATVVQASAPPQLSVPPSAAPSQVPPATPSRFCVACGAPLVASAKFCIKCGHPNPALSPAPSSPSVAPPSGLPPSGQPLPTQPFLGSSPAGPSMPPPRVPVASPTPGSTGASPAHLPSTLPSAGMLAASEVVLLFGDYFAPPAVGVDPWARLLHVPTRVSAAVLAQAIWAAAFLDCERHGAITLMPVGVQGDFAKMTYALKSQTVSLASYSLEANIVEIARLRLDQSVPLPVASAVADIIRFDSRNAWRHTVGLVKLGLNRRHLLTMTPGSLPAPFPSGRFALTPQVVDLARRTSPEPVQRLMATAQGQSARWTLLIKSINAGLQRRTNPMLNLPELDQDF
ncbi:serine/threonine-protein kinase [Chloracidobacterium aggregatum]|uniref:Protein kinase n=1 Tax=Chloracidobacterium sp. N TaxID=2821540 RepID=A0ABX8B2V1_9BACT|nr:serine/threonine-protein kinase [Chloracidobacterium aggregatum]QUV95254.1 protein kinase [Chloracidobacterium sp. N]QUV98482.1 protein kinase [Chloracidobacterium sp. E]